MSFRERILPVEEWPRLVGTELEPALAKLSPQTAQIVVVETDGQIVACWALLLLPHVEGVWVHPDYRNICSVTLRLWRGMRHALRAIGGTHAITGASSPEIQRLLDRPSVTKLPQEYLLCL